MIITCEQCSTSFILKDEIIKPTGSRVKCSKCLKVFKVFPPDFEETESPVITHGFETFSDGERPDHVIQEAPVSEPVKDKSRSPVFSDDLLDYTEYLKSDALPLALETQIPEIPASHDQYSQDNNLSDLSVDQSRILDNEAVPSIDYTHSETDTLNESLDDSEPYREKTKTGFDDIDILDISDIESFMEKKEPNRTKDGIEGYNNGSPVYDKSIHAVSSSEAQTDQPESYKDQLLTLEEIRLDSEETEYGRIERKKASFLTSKDEPEPIDSATDFQTEKSFSEPSFDDDSKPFPADTGDRNVLPKDSEGKKNINLPILIAFLAALVIGIGYGGYALLNSMGIISKQETSSINDPGNLKIRPFDVTSRFIDNVNAKKLFIITGKVKNDYPSARGYIKVLGKLYTKDNAMVKAETVFCGNIISDPDLLEFELSAINRRLMNPTGDNNINSKVMPGDAIPFMIVFANLPENLEEFTLEVVSSSQI